MESGEPALALHRGSYTVKQGCFRQVGPPPPIRRGGSFESETGFVSNKLSIPLQPLFFQSVEPDLRHPNPGVVSDKSGPCPGGRIIRGRNCGSFLKTNHQWTRMNTNWDGPPSMTSGARMHLRYRDLEIPASWEEAHPGARASRPHNTGRASPISSTRIDRQRRPGSAWAVPMRFPPAGWTGAASQGN